MKKRIIALGLVLLMTMSLFVGCKSNAKGEDLEYDKVVLTVGEHEVTLREAYFMVKYWQAEYQSIYANFLGDAWYEEAYDDDSTMEDYIKETVIEELKRTYIFLDHANEYDVSLSDEDKAAIDEAVKEFMSSNTDEALAAMGATEEVVRDYLTFTTEYINMYNAIAENIDTTVTDQEAKRKTYSYIYQSFTTTDETTGQSGEISTEQQNNYYAIFQQIKLEVENGSTFEDAATSYNYQIATHSYGSQDDGSYNDLNSVVSELEVGAMSDVIPVDGGVFLLRLDTDNDEEAAASAKEDIAADKLNNAFEELYEEYSEGVTVELNEELWATVNMKQPVASLVGEE